MMERALGLWSRPWRTCAVLTSCRRTTILAGEGRIEPREADSAAILARRLDGLEVQRMHGVAVGPAMTAPLDTTKTTTTTTTTDRRLVSEERSLIERMKLRARKRKLAMPALLAVY